MRRISTLRIIGTLLLAGSLTAAAVAFDETRDPWIRGIFTGNSPRAVITTDAEAWAGVNKIVCDVPDTFALIGTGQSMNPLYPAGTILVLREVDYRDLRSGQTVVYRNQKQRAVAHVLVAKARDGWRVRGLNNRTHDNEPVVAENLVGVVIAAFHPSRRDDDNTVATARRESKRAVFLSHDR